MNLNLNLNNNNDEIKNEEKNSIAFDSKEIKNDDKLNNINVNISNIEIDNDDNEKKKDDLNEEIPDKKEEIIINEESKNNNMKNNLNKKIEINDNI